jgi:hypothetical protein
VCHPTAQSSSDPGPSASAAGWPVATVTPWVTVICLYGDSVIVLRVSSEWKHLYFFVCFFEYVM